MKKTLLLIFALISSIGMAWADDPSSGSSTTENGNVPYTWAFTQNGTSVTILFERTGDGNASGFDDNARYIRVSKGNDEPAEVGAGNFVKKETNHGIEYTWINCNEGEKLNAVAQWNCTGGAAVTSKVSFTVGETGSGSNTPDINIDPADPATTADASLVYNVFSDDYSTSHLDRIQNVSAGTEASVKTINGGGHVYQISNSTNFDIKFTGGDVPVLNTEGHIAVYPTNDCTLTITPLFYADSGTKSFNYDVTANQWNYIAFNPQEYYTDESHKAQHYALSIAGMDSKTIYFDDLYYVHPIEEPAAAPVDVPTPSLDADQVFNIYSNKFGTNSTTKTGDWTMTEETINSKKTIKVEKFVWNGFSFASTDLSAYSKIHFDVYPVQEMPTIAIHVQGAGFDGYKTVNLTKGEWEANSFDLSLIDDLHLSADNIKAINNVLFNFNGTNGDGTGAFYYGNIYFWSDGPSITLTATPGTNTLLLGGATGATTNITTTVTEGENDVTSSSTITYTSNNTDVIEVSSAGVVTAKGLGTATVTVSATYNDITKTKDIDFTVLLPKPTEPTDLQTNVAVVFSSKYGYGTALNDCNAAYGKNGIPTDPIFTSVTYPTAQDNHKVVKVVGAVVNGRVLDPNNEYRAVNSRDGETPIAASMSEFAVAKISIWPTTATKGYFFGDNEFASEKSDFTLTPNQWNYITVMNPTTTNYVLVYLTQDDGTPETNFYLDHFYVTKPAAGEIFIGSPDNKSIAAVTGNITTSNVSAVEACTAKVIDISRTTLDEGVTSIALDNNQLLLVSSSSSIADNDAGNIVSAQATQLTGNTTNVIVKNGGYYWSYQPIVIIDDNAHQPNTAFNINVNKTGYEIQRTIGAGKYVTTYLPVGIVAGNMPEGLTVYEFDASSTDTEVKFNKRTTGMVASTPYVLHNSTDDNILLIATQAANSGGGNIDLNLTGTPTSLQNTDGTVSFKGNYAVITGEGETKWGLQNATTGVNPGRIGTNAQIGAFRAYFTGLSTTATARFFDGETTKIGTIDTNGNIETGVIYNLAGQRVQTPKKGIYIINEKKVVIK